MKNETKTGGQILTNAIRHLQRTTMNCRTWTMPIGDGQACDILSAAFAEYIRQSNRQFMAQFRIKPWSDEFDRINHVCPVEDITMTNNEFETELTYWTHVDAEQIGQLYHYYESATGREVIVSSRFDSTIAVKLIDTDTDKIVGIKVFPGYMQDSAINYAKAYVGQ